MKTKNKIKYICKNCKHIHHRWSGKCNICGEWNSIEEVMDDHYEFDITEMEITELISIQSAQDIRMETGISDLDLVLGGGLVEGSFVLIGGEPGVGKSTLILEISREFSKKNRKILYFSGEESPEQIKIRAERMKIQGNSILISRETIIEKICSGIIKIKPHLVVIDSIQTVQTDETQFSIPGTISQLKYSAFKLLEVAKTTKIPIIIIGHITREGNIAGPKLLEHMVDTVLYFESDRLNHYRILRSMKNRFGNVGEVAIFEMYNHGLRVIQQFQREIHRELSSGCVYTAIMEGTRAIAVELQALVTRSNNSPSKRMAEGLDMRRIILLIAVLEKFLKFNLSEQDIFVNLAGGLTSHEPALDFAISMAILSSYLEKPISSNIAFIGEIGLTGEIRNIPQLNSRIKELVNLGFTKIYIPYSQKKEIFHYYGDLIEVKHIQDIKESLL